MANTAKSSIWIDGHQAGDTLKKLQAHVRKLQNELNGLPVASDKYKAKMKELHQESKILSSHKDQIKGVSASYGQAQNSIGGMIKKFAPVAGVVGAIGLAIGGVTSAVSSWYNNNKEMEKSLSSLKSLTGASAEDVKFYKKEAQEMGRTTTLSATQVVEAYKLIGSARPDLLKNKEALAAVTKETIVLAEASEMELSGAAQAMTGIMNQFNLGAESSKRIINALAAGSKEGAADISSLSDTIDKSGAVMQGYNISVEQGIGLAETLAEKNIKGAEAGTQLRNVLLTMQGIEALPEKALAALKEYGVDTKKVADETVPFQERLKEMSKISGNATAMIQVFGKENIVAGKAILGNVDKVEQFTNAVTGTNVAYEQASINTDNLDGDLKSLGSAWEGLTLSMDGGGSVFRPIVQAGADMLNWVTDSIGAFKEWNTVDMETQYLKLLKVIPGVNLLMGDFIDQQIRVNEITSAVIDDVRVEGDQMMILTEALKKNNAALKNKNTTDEESSRIQEENVKIIAALNEKYPELTENMDLTKISASDMNNLQKELNKTIIEQAINTAKAAEQQRILKSIIDDTIAVQRLQQDEKSQSQLEQAWNKMMGNHSLDRQVNMIKEKKNLEGLNQTMDQVSKTVNGMDLQLGQEFKANGEIAQKAIKDLQKLVKLYDKETNETTKKGLKAQIDGLKETAKMTNKSQQTALDGALASFDKIQKSEEEAAQAAEVAADRKVEANKKAAESYKKLQEQLESLMEAHKKFQEDLDYNIKLDAFTEEQEKELFVLEHTLNEKYEKEIASATELSKKKGAIGIKGTEELNALLAIKEQELSHERLKINKKYADELKNEEYELAKDKNLLWLDQQASMEKALMDLKVLSAITAADAVADADINTRKAANEELRAILLEQLEFERVAKLSALQGDYESGKINKIEFDTQKEILEIDHRENIEQITKESDDKIAEASKQRLINAAESISSVVDILSQFMDAAFNNRINQIDKTKNAEVSALDEQLSKGIITKEEYETKKAEIERKADEERKIIENDKARKDKEVALAQATIIAAINVIKAIGFGPLAVISAIAAGAAQIAVIASTEVPQYADGGYTNVIGAQDGKMYNAKNVGRLSGGMTPHNPSLALISEEGPEYFVPNHLLQNQQVLNSVRVIEAIRTNQFADGGFTAAIGNAGGAMSDERLIAFLQANLSMLSALNSKIPNMRAVIDDRTVDAINTRTNELQQFRS